MEPNLFREARLEINRICEEIQFSVDQKAVDESKDFHQKAADLLEILTPQAEGEIQERSVKNLSVKINGLSTQISKLKPARRAASRSTKDIEPIQWDEDRVRDLSGTYLSRVLENMKEDLSAGVSFSTTGKGVRPSYQITYSDQTQMSFSGSGHTALKRNLPSGNGKISQPFSRSLIESIIH